MQKSSYNNLTRLRQTIDAVPRWSHAYRKRRTKWTQHNNQGSQSHLHSEVKYEVFSTTFYQD